MKTWKFYNTKISDIAMVVGYFSGENFCQFWCFVDIFSMIFGGVAFTASTVSNSQNFSPLRSYSSRESFSLYSSQSLLYSWGKHEHLSYGVLILFSSLQQPATNFSIQRVASDSRKFAMFKNVMYFSRATCSPIVWSPQSWSVN